MTLRAQVAIALALIVVLVIAIIGVGAGSAARGAAVDTVDRSLTRQLHELAHTDDGFHIERELSSRGGPDREQLGRSDQRSQIFVETGEVVRGYGPPLPISDNDLAIAAGIEPSSIRSLELEDGRWARMITGQIRLEGNVTFGVQIARTYEDLEAVRDLIFARTAWFALFGAAAAALLGWFLAGRITGPVEALTATAETVAETQDLSHRITISRTDEVGRLAGSFNSMLDALDTSRRQQRQLVQDANHELRTPLTSLRTNIELLQRKDNIVPEMRSAMMSDISSELDELTLLVEELVSSATDVGDNEEPDQEFELPPLAESVAARASRRSGRTITVDVGQAVAIEGKIGLVERAITNLVNNAVKFSPDGSPIEVVVDGARVEVVDHGPGIPAADRTQIFDRFFRSVEARSQPGSGLGLSIVRQVATLHGGEVWARETDGGGATVGFSLGANSVTTAP